MSKKPFDLHEERLGTTDQDGHRIYLYLDEVKGLWEKRRYIVYYFLLFIYLVIPWTKINGKQTLLLDIGNREFIIWGHSFYAHNIPLLFFYLLGFILLFAIITALWGRVWCGWACPQTVFIETIYRKIETWVEGKANKRRSESLKDHHKLDYYFKKTIKWTLFTIVSVMISHSFMAYFVGSQKLLHIVFQNPAANWSLFIVSVAFAALALFDFGWFREQFCIIICPYGRIQSVFMDENSLVVGYDYNRGEPRGKKSDPSSGDCVDCYRCVQVCPTGIDIRRGTQLECIHCTRCIDACDEIMEKIEKPKGLIRYSTEHELEGNSKKSIAKRLYIYGTILFAVFSLGSYFIYNSSKLDIHFVRSTSAPYKIVESSEQDLVVNHYKVNLFYNEAKTIDLNMKVLDTEVSGVNIVVPIKKVQLKASRKKTIYAFLKAPITSFHANEGKIFVKIGIFDGPNLLMEKELTLLGPMK